MPNNGRITLCPFYRDEKNLSISCEDTFRRFRWPSQKKRWMDTHCDKDWNKCPYAIALTKLYEGFVEGDEMGNNIKELSHKISALEKELRKTSSMLGRAAKREAAKDEQIAELQRKNRYLEDKYIEHRNTIEENKRASDLMLKEFAVMSNIYEGLVAYLMANFSECTLDKTDFDAWVDTHEYKLTADQGDEKRIIRYNVEVREIADTGATREVQETGGDETGTAGCKVEREGIEAEEVQE